VDPTSPGTSPLATFDRLLRALDHLRELATRAGADDLREWAALAGLDAIELGELLGLLHEVEAGRRREAIRAATDDLERRP
jgi:hypothetical protein